MPIARARGGIRPDKSTNKHGRSNRRHFARQNHRKKSSDGYEHEKIPRKLILSKFTGDGWMPCPIGLQEVKDWVCSTRLGSVISGRSIRRIISGQATTGCNNTKYPNRFRTSKSIVSNIRTIRRLYFCIY